MAGHDNNASLETVPEEENIRTTKHEEGVTIGDRYDGSDTDVDLGGSSQLGAVASPVAEEEGEEGEASSLFGSWKLKKYYHPAAAAWGVNPAERLMGSRRLVFNAPVVIILSLFFNFLLILILGVVAWKVSPPRTGGRPPDELVYSKSVLQQP